METIVCTDRFGAIVKTGSRIVLCGSMTLYPELKKIQTELLGEYVHTIVPEAEDLIKSNYTPEAFERFKRDVSFSYIKKIKDPRTFGVLAANFDRYNIPNYIGGNTFAEIAIAFAQSKRIYVLFDLPEVYKDELSAWGAISLNGNLDRIVEDYKEASYVKECRQLTLW